jgi:hypothetical protein
LVTGALLAPIIIFYASRLALPRPHDGRVEGVAS